MKASVKGQTALQDIAKTYGFRLYQAQAISSYYLKKAAYRAETDRGTLLIKPFIGTQKQLERISRFVRKLDADGYRHMPKWLKTGSGKLWIRREKQLYYVTKWVEGRKIRFDKKDMALLGRALGRLHSTSRRFGLSPPSKTEDECRELRYYTARFKKQLPSVRGGITEEGQWFQAEGHKALMLTEQAWKLLRQPKMSNLLAAERKRPGLSHGDITQPNALISGGKLYLIDWEIAGKKSTYYELAKALSNTAGFSIPLMKALLKGYLEKRRLSRGERKLVSVFFRFPREAWYACDQAYSGRSSAILFGVLRESWNDRLAAIEWLHAWARK